MIDLSDELDSLRNTIIEDYRSGRKKIYSSNNKKTRGALQELCDGLFGKYIKSNIHKSEMNSDTRVEDNEIMKNIKKG